MENETEKLVKRRKWKNRLSVAAIVAAAAAVSIASVGNYMRTRQASPQNEADRPDFSPDFNGASGVVMASGTTSVGVDAVTFGIDFLEDTALYVEEVYLSNGDTVQAGDKYIKFTEDSIADARSELKSAALSADLSYRSGVISDGESRLQAKYTYDMAVLEAQFAQQVYDDTAAQLEVDYAKSVTAYEDAQQAYEEYFEKIENDTFYEDYDIANLKKVYEEAKELYTERKAYWEVTDEELNSGSTTGTGTGNMGMSGMGMLSGSAGVILDGDTDGTGEDEGDTGGTDEDEGDTGGTDEDDEEGAPAFNENAGHGGFDTASLREAQAAQDDRKWIVRTVSLLEQEMEEAEENYTTALEKCEDEIASAELNLQKLFNQLEAAREDYTDAGISYQKQMLSAVTVYETAVAKGKTAQNDYDTQLTSLEDSLDRLRDAKEEADGNLALFERLVGDGYLYIEEGGTVLMLMAEEGKALVGGSMVFAYSNPEQLSVSVSVGQDDIARLYVGETAAVMISDYGNYTGVIEAINPVSSSNNRTSVSYTVTVNLQGDISGLGANLTASVVFGENASSGGGTKKPDMGIPGGAAGGGTENAGTDVPDASFGENMEKPDMDVPDGAFSGKEGEHGQPGKRDEKAPGEEN